MAFRRQLWVGYSALMLVTVATGGLGVFALSYTANNETQLSHRYTDELLQVERLRFAAERIVAISRGFMLMREPDYLDRLKVAVADLDADVGELEHQPMSAASRDDLEKIHRASRDYAGVAQTLAKEDTTEVVRGFERIVQPQRAALQQHIDALAHRERSSFEQELERASVGATRAGVIVGLAAGIGFALSMVLAVVVTRKLDREHELQRKAVQQARHAAAARKEVLAVVSHDLRNPLSTILMATELLDMNLAALTIPDPRRHVRMIRIATEHMRQLVEQILDAAQIDAGTLQLRLGSCDVSAVMAEAVELLEPAAAHASIVLRSESRDLTLTAHADRERVLQILVNLLGNAIKFTPNGGTITLRTRDLGNSVQVSVEDSGRGISAEKIPRLFERYWQDEPGDSSTGVGLGLYICKALVDAHQGRIWAESQLGRGSCFHFTLPRENQTAAEDVGRISREPLMLSSG